MARSGQRVIVVGAGIIGASIAWHLARDGARVTLIDAGEPGGVATPNSFSWINSNYSFDRQYFALRAFSMGEWRRLASEVPGLPVSLTGSIYLPADGVPLEAFVAQHSQWGYRISLIDGAKARELEPRLLVETDIAALAEDEGAAEAEEVARMLAACAAEEGAVLKSGERVERLALSDGRARGVRAGGETLEADDVVVAAGAATPEILADAGFEMAFRTPPGLLAHTTPVSPVVDRIILADGLHVRQKPNGSLLLGADFQGSVLSDDPEGGARELLHRLAGCLRIEGKVEVARTTVGERTTPGDGRPVAGRVPGVAGLYAAVMHSGVTLAPAIGRLVARDLLRGERDPLLAPYGPERFLTPPLAATGA